MICRGVLRVGALLLAAVVLAACGTGAPSPARPTSAVPAPAEQSRVPRAGDPDLLAVRSWAYQLQAYRDGKLDQLAAGPYQLVVVDLARDAGDDYFRADEVAAVRATGKRVLAYFEIGSIEDFRPEYRPLRDRSPDLVLNRWESWPQEFFVRYWDERWWDGVVAPRLDQALAAGFDGVYLDTPLAYEEIDLATVPGATRAELARRMADLVIRMSRYAKERDPGFLVFPQNSPELRSQTGYVEAIDGIGIEELFFRATDEPCTQDYCTANLADVRALRDAGKLVLAVDYAAEPQNVRTACARYRQEGFAGYVAPLELDRVTPPCSAPG